MYSTCILLLCRSFAKPPKQVQTVCECIVIMRGFKEVNWKTARGMMADTNFLNTLQHMDVDGISQAQVCNNNNNSSNNNNQNNNNKLM